MLKPGVSLVCLKSRLRHVCGSKKFDHFRVFFGSTIMTREQPPQQELGSTFHRNEWMNEWMKLGIRVGWMNEWMKVGIIIGWFGSRTIMLIFRQEFKDKLFANRNNRFYGKHFSFFLSQIKYYSRRIKITKNN